MAFGAFDFTNFLKGDNSESSFDPNSPNYAGGSFNKAFDPVKDRSLLLFNQVNKRPLQFADASGFMPYQREGMNEFAKNLFSASSGRAAAGGAMMPDNFNAVVGSALTRALPNLFAIQNDNQFIPTRIANERMGILAPLIQAGHASLGPGVGYNNLNTANSNYWNMMNNIGSFWGAGGAKGAGGGGGLG